MQVFLVICSRFWDPSEIPALFFLLHYPCLQNCKIAFGNVTAAYPLKPGTMLNTLEDKQSSSCQQFSSEQLSTEDMASETTVECVV